VSPSSAAGADGLVHVLVCGGTPREWGAMSGADWGDRFAEIARGVGRVGARWVTVMPHHSSPGAAADLERMTSVFGAMDKVEQVPAHASVRYLWRRDDGLGIVVDPHADGHARFATVVESMRLSGEAITDESLSVALLEPVPGEPDLALILGRPDTLPTSLVWELAYSELVFLDIDWSALQAGHLEMAIDDFNRRHRRFGGLDS